MKRIFTIFAIFAISLPFFSCSQDLLEIPQKGVVTIDNFYQTDEDAENALVAMYNSYATEMMTTDYPAGNYIPWYAAFNVCGDDFLAAGKEYGSSDFYAEMNEFRYDSQNTIIDLVYARYYKMIYNANLIIDNFKDGTSETMKRCVAEARVLRAYCHMMLAIGWGAAPLADHVLGANEALANYEGGQKGLLEWAGKECEEAVANLEERKSTSDKEATVKFTKGVAWSVAGKAYLFAGNYAKARENLKKVIDSGKYALVPGERWAENFHQSGDGNEEKILEVNFVATDSRSRYQLEARSKWQMLQSFCWRTDRLATKKLPWLGVGSGWGCCAIQQDFAQEFLDNDGDSFRRKATFLTPDEFLYEMEWYAGSNDMTQAEKEVDEGRGIKNTAGLYGNGLYMCLKNMPLKEDVDHSSRAFGFTNTLVMRYAEVLLMYAEVAAVDGDSDGLGLKCLNDIQKRAGAPVSATLTLDAVKKEKSYEMWLEGCRWADQVRWGDTDRLERQGDKIPSLKDAFFNTENPEPKHRLYVTYSYPNGEGYSKFEEKHKLFPFPYSAIQTNPNLKQNPGWE